MSKLPWHVDVAPIRRWIAWMEQSGKGDEAWSRVELWDAMVLDYGVVRSHIDGQIGTIELCYPPKANAYVPPMYKLFVSEFSKLEENDDVRVIVITGAEGTFSTGGYVGRDAFYAGLDAGDGGSTPEPMRRTFVEMFQPLPARVYNCEKPTIAMVNGRVMAEANDLAMAADIRTAKVDTEFWFSFGYTGNTAFTGSAWLLPRIVGLGPASHLLLTAGRVNGEEALRLGLVGLLAKDQEELAAKTREVADRICSLPPITLRLIKKEIHRGLEVLNFDTNLDFTSMIEPIVQATEDHMDAEEAIIEKRAPVVRGR
jgi:2-(1,2-epoxy-1,2-dihydrophenyl)acetyl-CoA isomerase